jgi:energy-coupling factor transporter ATP-binding protein EcfA2
MACCAGTERTADSKAIDAELKTQHAAEKNALRVLILGTSASGKSTICKQMRIIHSTGPSCFTQHELDNYKQILILNIFNGMKELIIQAEIMNIKVMRKNKKIAAYFTEVNPYTEKLDAETVSKAKQLWADKGSYSSPCICSAHSHYPRAKLHVVVDRTTFNNHPRSTTPVSARSPPVLMMNNIEMRRLTKNVGKEKRNRLSNEP